MKISIKVRFDVADDWRVLGFMIVCARREQYYWVQLQWLEDHDNRVEQDRTDAKFLSSIEDQNIESSLLEMFQIVPSAQIVQICKILQFM